MGRRQKQLKPTKVFQDEDAEDGQTSAPTCSNFATRAESPSRNPTRNNRETTTTTKADFEKKISNFSISAHLKESSKNDGSQEKDPVSKDLLSKWAISQFSSPVQQVFPSQLYPYLASADAYNPFYPGLGMDTLPSAASYETFFKGMDSEAQRNYFASMLHLLPTSSTSANSFPQDAQQSHLLQRHGYANGNKEHLHKKKKHQSTPSASRNLTTNSNTANSVKARSGLGRASGSSTGQGQRQKEVSPSTHCDVLDLSMKGGAHKQESSESGAGKGSGTHRKASELRSNNTNGDGNALNQLSSLVSTMSNKLSSPFRGMFGDFPLNPGSASFAELYQQFLQNGFGNSSVKSNEVDQSKIFTCLQCFQSFDSLQQLVKHMEKTQHFNSSKLMEGRLQGLQTNNGKEERKRKCDSISPSPHPSNKPSKATRYSNGELSQPTVSQQHSRSNGSSNGATYRFQCLLCDHSSDSSIERHMTREHSFTSPNEWISAVKLIPL